MSVLPEPKPPCLSNHNPLHFIERNLITSAVVKLGRARAFMRGHGLGIFERSTSLEIRGDPGSAENMAAELLLEPGFCGAAADHPIGINAVHQLAGQRAGSAARTAEEGAFAIIADAGSGEIFVNEGFELVMRRHLVAL